MKLNIKQAEIQGFLFCAHTEAWSVQQSFLQVHECSIKGTVDEFSFSNSSSLLSLGPGVEKWTVDQSPNSHARALKEVKGLVHGHLWHKMDNSKKRRERVSWFKTIAQKPSFDHRYEFQWIHVVVDANVPYVHAREESMRRTEIRNKVQKVRPYTNLAREKNNPSISLSTNCSSQGQVTPSLLTFATYAVCSICSHCETPSNYFHWFYILFHIQTSVWPYCFCCYTNLISPARINKASVLSCALLSSAAYTAKQPIEDGLIKQSLKGSLTIANIHVYALIPYHVIYQ